MTASARYLPRRVETNAPAIVGEKAQLDVPRQRFAGHHIEIEPRLCAESRAVDPSARRSCTAIVSPARSRGDSFSDCHVTDSPDNA